MWDFSGKPEYQKIRNEFYTELHGIVYVFDINNSNSFNNLDNWLKECKKNGGDKLVVGLVANKTDLSREVQYSNVEDLLKKYPKMLLYELSGKEGGDPLKKFFNDYGTYLLENLPKENKKK